MRNRQLAFTRTIVAVVSLALWTFPAISLADDQTASADHLADLKQRQAALEAQDNKLKAMVAAQTDPAIKARNQALLARVDQLLADGQAQIDALEKPAPFDSRSLITQDEYDFARTKEQELLKRQRGLQTEMTKLKAWQRGLQTDTDEFAKIQNDAQIDYLHDVLMNIPAGETFEIFAAAKYITPEQAGTLSAGYDAIKGLVSTAEGIDSTDSQEQLEKILAGQKSLRDAMLDQVMAKLKDSNLPADQASFQWLQNVGKTFDAAREMIAYSQQKDHSPQALATLGVKLCTVAVPLANFVVIGDTLAEKKLTQSIVQEPLDSLNEAMSKNFDAQRYLTVKLDSVNYNLALVQETVKNYQAVHGNADQ